MIQTYVFKRPAADPRNAAPAFSASFTQQLTGSAPGFTDNRAVLAMVNRAAADADLTLVKTVSGSGNSPFMLIEAPSGILSSEGADLYDQNGLTALVARIIAGAVILRPGTEGVCHASVDLGVKASGTITSNNTNPANASTIKIGNKTYTFVTTIGASFYSFGEISAGAGPEGNVLIGANATATLANLSAAVNKGAGGGTVYVAAAAHTQVSAAVSGLVLTLKQLVPSVAPYTLTVNASYFTSSGLVSGGIGNVISLPSTGDEQCGFFDLGGDGVPYGGDTDDMSIQIGAAGGSTAHEMTLVLFLKAAP